MTVNRHHYMPTEAQKAEIMLVRQRLQARLLRLRAVNTVKAEKPEVQKAARNLLLAMFADVDPAQIGALPPNVTFPTRPATPAPDLAALRAEFMAHDWSDSAAGELAEIHARLHGGA